MRWIGLSLAALLMLALLSVANLEGQNRPKPSLQPSISNVKDFGALGDGEADDTAAIRRAIESGRGEIHFPRGTYRVSETISIDLARVGPTSLVGAATARILMSGAGPAVRFVGTHAGTADPSSVKENVWQVERAPLVSGLEIVGEHPEAIGIQAEGTMQLTIKSVMVRNTLHGIHLVKRNRNVIIEGSHVYHNKGVGIFYDQVNLHQSNIVGCHVSYNAGGGIVVRGGDVRNIQIGTCDIEGNMSATGSPTANVLLDSTGGSIGEVAIVGCTIQHDHRAPESANIRINGESTARPFTDEKRHGNITIADNVLSDVQVNIDLQNTRGITITGNTMWKGYSYNLRASKCSGVLVSDNVCDRNPRYHYGDGGTAKLGMLFEDCDGATLQGNHLHGGGEVAAELVVRRCRRFNIIGCTILDYAKGGLLLQDVSASRVADCLIQSERADADFSLQVSGGGDVMAVDNLLGNPSQLEGTVSNGNLQLRRKTQGD